MQAENPPAGTRRGRLTVYVGAAPGAGKTYAMLQEGRRLRDQGRDVVAGLVEAYGRPRTTEAQGDLEALSPLMVGFQGHDFPTVDVTGIVRRRPEVVLVDEIYRTNPPGARHEKRWQDIEELRDHGIDVLTTMNIQHLEGMKDIAEAIAGLNIRETVPDELIEKADEVQLVDISPEALRKRMQHGNIYPQQNVDRALTGFFRQGNLAALREMALRWLAEAQSRGETGDAPPTEESVLVAVRPRPEAEVLVRRAARMARRLRCRCTVLSVLRPGEAEPDDLLHLRRVVELLHADMRVVEDANSEHAIGEAVRALGATQLVLGEPQGGGLMARYRGDIVDHLIEAFPQVDIHVISRARATEARVDTSARQSEPVMAHNPTRYLRVYVSYAPGCGTTTAMLHEGQRRHERGTDVVVGAVSVHGREETAEALAGLEVIPGLPSEGRGSPDMDVETVLGRSPDVCCVDDLAHHNAPGRAADWRWQEVQRLLDAGIRVISTLHVFDLEGVTRMLGPDAAALSRQPVSDSILDMANEIELVDVPPALLLERLQTEREQSGERRRDMLDLELLTRLREAALRLVAAQTENKLLAYMRQRGINQPWESTPRVMACVAPRPGMDRVIDKAAEYARRADGKLEVVTVVSGRTNQEQDALLRAYAARATEAGGQFVSLHSASVASALLEHAQTARVTEIILARGRGMRGSDIKRTLLHQTSGIDVHVLREERAAESARKPVAAG